MHFELQLSVDWNAKAAYHDFATADESVLRYGAFLGDLSLQFDDFDFSARWGWIPLLDLAYSLKDMCDEILTGAGEGTFEFTESDAWLRFSRQGDAVEISASYVPHGIVLKMGDLCAAVTHSAQVFFMRIATRYSDLASNPSFQRMRRSVFAAPTAMQ